MSEASWDTLSIRGPRAGKVSFTIKFASGRSLLVPILISASVSDLKSEALRRAQINGIQIPLGECGLLSQIPWVIIMYSCRFSSVLASY